MALGRACFLGRLLSNPPDEGNRRGAFFELHALNSVSPNPLHEINFEWRSGATGSSVEWYIPSLQLALELMSVRRNVSQRVSSISDATCYLAVTTQLPNARNTG